MSSFNALDQKLSNWDIGVVIIYFILVIGASIFVKIIITIYFGLNSWNNLLFS